jgi:hypothetical protein
MVFETKIWTIGTETGFLSDIRTFTDRTRTDLLTYGLAVPYTDRYEPCFYTNRNYFNNVKTHIEPYFLNVWMYMSDFLVWIRQS